jgi:hypothetical protein
MLAALKSIMSKHWTRHDLYLSILAFSDELHSKIITFSDEFYIKILAFLMNLSQNISILPFTMT